MNHPSLYLTKRFVLNNRKDGEKTYFWIRKVKSVRRWAVLTKGPSSYEIVDALPPVVVSSHFRKSSAERQLQNLVFLSIDDVSKRHRMLWGKGDWYVTGEVIAGAIR